MFDVNRTSSMPKSVLHYEFKKYSTSNWKLPLTNIVPQINYYGMDIPTLSLFLRPIVTVFSSKTGETGDIYWKKFFDSTKNSKKPNWNGV